MTVLTRRARAWRARVLKLFAILRCKPYRRALRLGVAASTEHAYTALPHDYATVLDVGANRGQFALLAAHRFPHARIICFEPLRAACATLERVFTNQTRIQVHATAVAATATESQIFVSRADDSSSLLAPTALQLANFPGTDVVELVSVKTERLDVLVRGMRLAPPVLLKIDVQGAELDVLTGATGILDDVDTVLVECSFMELYEGQPLADEIVRFLQHHGFRFADVTAPCVNAAGHVVQADLVFSREHSSL